MEKLLDSALSLWSGLLANPPMLVSVGCVALAVVLGLILLVTRSGRRPRLMRLTPDEKKRRPRQAIARSIAAQGASPREIARRSRLSHDAVAILLDRSAQLADRKSQPSAARIAQRQGIPAKDAPPPRNS
jgi:hypothetical protein